MGEPQLEFRPLRTVWPEVPVEHLDELLFGPFRRHSVSVVKELVLNVLE